MKKNITDKHQKVGSFDAPKKIKLASIAKAVSLSIFGLGMINGLSHAATIEVDTSLDGNSNCTLRRAIDSMIQQGVVNGCSAVGSFGSSDKITFANTIGDLITLQQGELNIAPMLGNNSFEINASNISGGLTIDANGNSRVFYISGANIAFESLNIIGGTTGFAAFAYGGGIYVADSTFSLVNSSVSGNRASLGGGLSISSFSEVYISNSIISKNSATDNGGGISDLGESNQITIVNSEIANNYSRSGGGGASFRSQVTISDSTVSSNSAYSGYYPPSGSNGGGFSLDGSATVTVTNTIIRDNKADSGGGIAINASGDSTLVLKNSTVENNSASIVGGGIYSFTGVVNIDETYIRGNRASGGGGIRLREAEASINSSEISANVVDYAGGGISTFATSLTLDSTDLINNTAGGDGGGAIFSRADSLVLSNSNITDNFAYSGGGIDIAGTEYGAMGFLNVRNSTISTNSSSLGGGVSLGVNGSFTATNTNISRNSSDVGGGIFSSDGVTVLEDSTLSNNSANYVGGAVSLTDSSRLTFKNGLVSRNRALNGRGGAFWIRESSRATIDQSLINANTAAYGGGIIAYGGGAAILTNTTISANSASLIGGGLLPFNTGRVVLTNSTVATNIATDSGGGVFVASEGTLSLTNSIIADSGSGDDCNSYNASISSDSVSIIESGDCVSGARKVDPKLMPLSDNGGSTLTHALMIGSQASNKGILSSCPVVDQRGETRGIEDGFCDVGAFELNSIGAGLGYLPGILKLLLLDEGD